MTTLSYNASIRLRNRMLADQRHLANELERLDADRYAASRAIDERIVEITGRVRSDGNFVSVPLDELIIPAMRLGDVVVTNGDGGPRRPAPHSTRTAVEAKLAVDGFRDRRKRKSNVVREADAMRQLDTCRRSASVASRK